MIDSSDIRVRNKSRIWREMLSRKKYTKQQMAFALGLSVATCNTLLNELKEEGKVKSESEKLGTVGRNSAVYILNEEYEYILCLDFRLIKGEKILSYYILNLYGDTLVEKMKFYDTLDESSVLNVLDEILKEYDNVSIISIGTPSIAENGIIKYCDITELEGSEIIRRIKEKYDIEVLLENDMHLKCYGYYKKECVVDETVTLAFFPSGVLPGTSTVVEGKVIRGANMLAGMVGFLPFGISREEVVKNFIPQKYFEFAVRSIASLIVILNPNKIIMCGDLIDEDEMKKIEKECENVIPVEYLPQFIYKENIENYYLEGMYERAVDKIMNGTDISVD